MDVLHVDGDAALRDATALDLRCAGISATGVATAERALELLLHPHGRINGYPMSFDALLTDLALPDMDGFELCRVVRRTFALPLVVASHRCDVVDVVASLEAGADDFVRKPYDVREVAARLRAVTRRAARGAESGVLSIRDVVIDTNAYRAYRAGADLGLTSTEFNLLTELATHAGHVLTRRMLLERVWGHDYLGESRLVDMAVNRLRTKLREHDPPPVPYIATVRGAGYRFQRV